MRTRIASSAIAIASALFFTSGCDDDGNTLGKGGDGAGVGEIPPTGVATKVDLLVMVDNSSSMADKQAVLAEALPGLVNALTTPPLDGDGQPAFKPVTDIHFGVITSSLGGHGADVCSPESGSDFNATQNDRAHLVGSVRTDLPSYNGQGFLWWDPTGQFGGESDPSALAADFADHIQAAGEQGCGYEASLESWYRFLIDPEPPLDVTTVDGVTQLTGIDDALLQQRSDFLRPDSLVIIVMLSDENDCSMVEEGQSWMFAQANGGGVGFHMPAGSSACATDPNSVCCRSCTTEESSPPPGCAPLESDPACVNPLDDLEDHLNLRCWDQRRRFGITNLHPTRRYVDGLTKSLVPDRSGNLVDNPLFTDSSTGQISRAQNMVLFVPIVGVPWQDIATADSLTGSGLTYLSPDELANQGRWSWLLPACKTAGADGVCDEWDLADQPDDPLMIESINPRTGVNPATNAALAPPSSAVGANPINGHEYDIPENNELQYACIFELEQPRDCATVPDGEGCNCEPVTDLAASQNPVCQAPDGSYSSVQRRAKAHPGTRQLQVAKDLGSNAVLGSVCPKAVGPSSTAHAYIPVVDAVARQLVGRLVK